MLDLITRCVNCGGWAWRAFYCKWCMEHIKSAKVLNQMFRELNK